MNRNLTKREKVLLIFMLLMLIGLVYYRFILSPILEQTESYTNMADAEESMQSNLLITVQRINKMQKEIDLAKESGEAHPLPAYDNSVGLGFELNDILSGANDYLIDFGEPVIYNGTVAVRPVKITFNTASYEQAAAILRRLHNSEMTNEISDLNIKLGGGSVVIGHAFLNDGGRRTYNIRTTLTTNFFEIVQ